MRSVTSRNSSHLLAHGLDETSTKSSMDVGTAADQIFVAGDQVLLLCAT